MKQVSDAIQNWRKILEEDDELRTRAYMHHNFTPYTITDLQFVVTSFKDRMRPLFQAYAKALENHETIPQFSQEKMDIGVFLDLLGWRGTFKTNRAVIMAMMIDGKENSARRLVSLQAISNLLFGLFVRLEFMATMNSLELRNECHIFWERSVDGIYAILHHLRNDPVMLDAAAATVWLLRDEDVTTVSASDCIREYLSLVDKDLTQVPWCPYTGELEDTVVLFLIYNPDRISGFVDSFRKLCPDWRTENTHDWHYAGSVNRAIHSSWLLNDAFERAGFREFTKELCDYWSAWDQENARRHATGYYAHGDVTPIVTDSSDDERVPHAAFRMPLLGLVLDVDLPADWLTRFIHVWTTLVLYPTLAFLFALCDAIGNLVGFPSILNNPERKWVSEFIYWHHTQFYVTMIFLTLVTTAGLILYDLRFRIKDLLQLSFRAVFRFLYQFLLPIRLGVWLYNTLRDLDKNVPSDVQVVVPTTAAITPAASILEVEDFKIQEMATVGSSKIPVATPPEFVVSFVVEVGETTNYIGTGFLSIQNSDSGPRFRLFSAYHVYREISLQDLSKVKILSSTDQGKWRSVSFPRDAKIAFLSVASDVMAINIPQSIVSRLGLKPAKIAPRAPVGAIRIFSYQMGNWYRSDGTVESDPVDTRYVRTKCDAGTGGASGSPLLMITKSGMAVVGMHLGALPRLDCNYGIFFGNIFSAPKLPPKEKEEIATVQESSWRVRYNDIIKNYDDSDFQADWSEDDRSFDDFFIPEEISMRDAWEQEAQEDEREGRYSVAKKYKVQSKRWADYSDTENAKQPLPVKDFDPSPLGKEGQNVIVSVATSPAKEIVAAPSSVAVSPGSELAMIPVQGSQSSGSTKPKSKSKKVKSSQKKAGGSKPPAKPLPSAPVPPKEPKVSSREKAKANFAKLREEANEAKVLRLQLEMLKSMQQFQATGGLTAAPRPN